MVHHALDGQTFSKKNGSWSLTASCSDVTACISDSRAARADGLYAIERHHEYML